MTTYLPLVILASLLVLTAGTIVGRVLQDRRHVPSPADGCCGCGADECDVIVDPDERGRGEGYCWSCINSWPDDAPSPSELGYIILPGRDVVAGRAQWADWRDAMYRKAVQINAAAPHMGHGEAALIEAAHAEALAADR
jgi:hypothetical protein